MAYRDERDALRERVQSLEQNLGEAQKELSDARANEHKQARVEEIERRMREAERDLRMLSAELAAVRGVTPRPQGNKGTLVFVAAGAVLGLAPVAATAAFLLIGRPAPTPPPRVVQQPEEPAVVNAPVPPTPEPPAPIPPPPTAKRQVTASWKGKVTRATGLGIAPGAACEITAKLEGNGQDGKVTALDVLCGGKPLYRSSDRLEGMSMNSAGFAEIAGKEAGTLVYAIKYTDTGSRAGPRTQASLDTTQSVGAAWSEVVPAFRVDFSVAQESAPVRGERLTAENKP